MANNNNRGIQREGYRERDTERGVQGEGYRERDTERGIQREGYREIKRKENVRERERDIINIREINKIRFRQWICTGRSKLNLF